MGFTIATLAAGGTTTAASSFLDEFSSTAVPFVSVMIFGATVALNNVRFANGAAAGSTVAVAPMTAIKNKN